MGWGEPLGSKGRNLENQNLIGMEPFMSSPLGGQTRERGKPSVEGSIQTMTGYASAVEILRSQGAVIGAGRGTFQTISVQGGDDLNLINFNDIDYAAEIASKDYSPKTAGRAVLSIRSSREWLLGPFSSTATDFTSQWEGYYLNDIDGVSLGGSGGYGDLEWLVENPQTGKLDVEVDNNTYISVNQQNEIVLDGGDSKYLTRFGLKQVATSENGAYSLTLSNTIKQNEIYLSKLNATRAAEGSVINITEQADDSYEELFTIHANKTGDHKINFEVNGPDSLGSQLEKAQTDGLTRGANEASTLGNDYHLYWGAPGLQNPNADQLTWIDPSQGSFTWSEDKQSGEYPEISIYAKVLADNFAEANERSTIKVWGETAGKVTFESTIGSAYPGQDFWTQYGSTSSEEYYDRDSLLSTYLGGPVSRLLASNSAGYLEFEANLDGYGGRIEFDVMFGDSWDGEALSIRMGDRNTVRFTRKGSEKKISTETKKTGEYTVTLYPYDDYGANVGNPDVPSWLDQSARISIEVPTGIQNVNIGVGTQLDQIVDDEFLAIDNVFVVEPEVTQYTLSIKDDDPVLSFGSVGYFDDDNNFKPNANGEISEGENGAIEILIKDEEGESIEIQNPTGLYVSYEIVTTTSTAQEGVDFFAPKGVMSTKSYLVEDFVKLDPGQGTGYLSIAAVNDAVVEGEELVTVRLLDKVSAFTSAETGKTPYLQWLSSNDDGLGITIKKANDSTVIESGTSSRNTETEGVFAYSYQSLNIIDAGDYILEQGGRSYAFKVNPQLGSGSADSPVRVTSDTSFTYRSYVVDPNTSTKEVKITDAPSQPWVKEIAITEHGRTDDFIRAQSDGTVKVDLRLKSAIEEDLLVSFEGSNYTFKPENWDVPQTVSLSLTESEVAAGAKSVSASAEGGWTSGSTGVKIYANSNLADAKIVLHEGSEQSADVHRFTITGGDQVEGNKQKQVAYTVTRNTADSQHPFEIYLESVEGDINTLSGESLVSYEPLEVGDGKQTVRYEGIKRTDGKGDYTLSLWVKPDEIGTAFDLLNIQDSGTGSARLSVDSDGKLIFSDRITEAPYISFNGDGDYIEAPQPVGLPTGRDRYTISAWIRIPETGQRGGSIVGWGNSDDAQGSTNVMQVRPGNEHDSVWAYHHKVKSVRAGGPGIDYFNVDDGNWHNIVITGGGSGSHYNTIYVDGKQIKTGSFTGVNIKGSNLFFGRTPFDAQASPNYLPFTGDMKDIRIWNDTLTSKQIGQLQDGRDNIETNDLIAKYFDNAYNPLANSVETSEGKTQPTIYGDVLAKGEHLTTSTIRSEDALKENEWQHISVQYDNVGNEYRLYINGDLTAKQASLGVGVLGMAHNRYSVSIGDSSEDFQARGLKIVNDAQSESSIKTLMFTEELITSSMLDAPLNGEAAATSRSTGQLSTGVGDGFAFADKVFAAKLNAGSKETSLYIRQEDDTVYKGNSTFTIRPLDNGTIYENSGTIDTTSNVIDDDVVGFTVHALKKAQDYRYIDVSDADVILGGANVKRLTRSGTGSQPYQSYAFADGTVVLPGIPEDRVEKAFTFSSWIRRAQDSFYPVLAATSINGKQIYARVQEQKFLLQLPVDGGVTEYQATLPSGIDVNEWHHWSVGFDLIDEGSTQWQWRPSVWLDGDALVLQETTGQANSLSRDQQSISFGNLLLVDVSSATGIAVHSGVLSGGEVEELIASGSVPLVDNLIYGIDLSTGSAVVKSVEEKSIDIWPSLSDQYFNSGDRPTTVSGISLFNNVPTKNASGYIIDSTDKGSTTLGLSLKSKPLGTVYVKPTTQSGNQDNLTITLGNAGEQNVLTFTPDNYSVPQPITVTVKDGDIGDSHETIWLDVRSDSEDQYYKNASVKIDVEINSSLPDLDPSSAGAAYSTATTFATLELVSTDANKKYSENEQNKDKISFRISLQDSLGQAVVNQTEDTVIYLRRDGNSSASSEDVEFATDHQLTGLALYQQDDTTGKVATIDQLNNLENLSDRTIITGYIQAPESGFYSFIGSTNGSADLRVNDEAILSLDGEGALKTGSGTIALRAGDYIPIKIDYSLSGQLEQNQGLLNLMWILPGDNTRTPVKITGLQQVGALHVVVPAGQSSVELEASVVNDDFSEIDERYTLSLEQELAASVVVNTAQAVEEHGASFNQSRLDLEKIYIDNEWTIGAWVNLEEVNTIDTIFDAKEGKGNRNRISLKTNNGALEFWSWDSKGKIRTLAGTAPGLIEAGKWHYVAASIDEDTIRLMVDGEVRQKLKLPFKTAINTSIARSKVRLGYGANWAEALEGKMRDFTVFDQSLSVAEIQEVMASSDLETDLPKFDVRIWLPLDSVAGYKYDYISNSVFTGLARQSTSAIDFYGNLAFNAGNTIPLLYAAGERAYIELKAGSTVALSTDTDISNSSLEAWPIVLKEDIRLIKGIPSRPVRYGLVDANQTGLPTTETLLTASVLAQQYQLPVVVDQLSQAQIDPIKSEATIIISENDPIGVIFESVTLELAEGNPGVKNTVRLNSQPNKTVTVFIVAEDESAIALKDSPETIDSKPSDPVLYLTFTPETWNDPQDFYTVAIDDQIAEDTLQSVLHVSTLSEDPLWDNKSSLIKGGGISADFNTVGFSVVDNETPGIRYNAISHKIDKASNGYAYISLDSKPVHEVTLTLQPESSGQSAAKVLLNNKSINRAVEIRFDEGNWNIPQAVEIIAVDDNIASGTVDTRVLVSATSADSKYNGLRGDDLNVRIIDDDVATARIVSVYDARENGKPGAFKVVLDAPASSDSGSTGIEVEYEISGFKLDDYLKTIKEGTNQSEESYTEISEWLALYTTSPGGNLSGRVRIAPGNTESKTFIIPIDEQVVDSLIIDNETGLSGKQLSVSLSTPAAGANYKLSSNLSDQTANINIINNDQAGVALIKSGSLLTASEDGVAAELGVVLLSQPKGTVTIDISELTDTATAQRVTLSGGNDGSGQLVNELTSTGGSISTLTFNAQNWSLPQLVNIKAEKDYFKEDGGKDSGYEGTGLHSSKIKLNFTSTDDAYNSDPINKPNDFTNETVLDVLVLDQSLSPETAQSIASTLGSLEDGFSGLEVPFLGKMAGKYGSPFEQISASLLPQITKLGDQLTPDRLLSVIQDSGLFSSANMAVIEEGGQNAAVEIQLNWADVYNLYSLPLDAELGIPGLGFKSEGSIGAEVGLATGIGLRIPLSKLSSPELLLDASKTNITANLKLDLSEDFAFSGGLGFVTINATQDPEASSGMNVIAEISLDKQGDSASSLSYANLTSSSFDITDYVDYGINDESTAQLSLNAEARSSLGAVIPNVSFDIKGDMSPIFQSIDPSYQSTTGTAYTISLEDINLDIGSFAMDMFAPVLKSIGDILNPIRPLTDAFYTDTKIFASLGMVDQMDDDGDGIVTPLDMLIKYAELFGDAKAQRNAQKAKTFLSTLNTVYGVIDEFKALSKSGETFKIEMGSYEVEIDSDSSKNKSASSATPTAKTGSNTPSNTKGKALGGVNDSAYVKKVGSAITKLYELGFSIPLIEAPTTVVDLILGKNVDLFTWTIPGLEADLTIQQGFPLWPAPKIDGVVEGGFGAEAFITLGFDTQGFLNWQDKDFAADEAWRAFDGFYVADNAGDEVEVSANLGVGVAGSVGLAKATVTGGVEASMGFDLIDSGEFNGTSDDKLRASEITSRISNPLSLFDISGSLSAYLNAQLQVGLDMGLFSKWWTVWKEKLDLELFSFALGASGSHGNGPIAGSIVGYDANFNGRLDPSEPYTRSLADGSYKDLYIDLRTFDRNRNGKLDIDEGRKIAFSGIDTVGDVPVSSVMFAPYGAIISPLTTLYSTALSAGIDESIAKKTIQQVFSITGWDFTSQEPIEAINAEANKPNKLARKAALAHALIHWSLNRLIREAETIASSDGLSNEAKVSLVEGFGLALFAGLKEVDDLADVTKTFPALTNAMMSTLSSFADELGKEGPDPTTYNLLAGQIAFVRSALENSFAEVVKGEDFIANLAIIKRQFLNITKLVKNDFNAGTDTLVKMGLISDLVLPSEKTKVTDAGVALSKTALQLSQPSNNHSERSSTIIDIQALMESTGFSHLEKKSPSKRITAYTIDDKGQLKTAAYNPLTGKGARSFDLDSDGITDYLAYNNSPELHTGTPATIEETILTGLVDVYSVFETDSNHNLSITDPNNRSLEVGLVIKAKLNSRPSSAGFVGYLVLDAAEVATVDSLFADLELLRNRSQTLFTSLENEDTFVAEGIAFEKDIYLLNGQSVRFFEVIDVTLDELKSADDPRLNIISLGDLEEGDRNLSASSQSGLSFDIEINDSDLSLNALIGDKQGKNPILDFSFLNEQNKVSGNVVVSREATYDALTGFYRIVDKDGAVLAANGIDIVRPGESGYTDAAIRDDNVISAISDLSAKNRGSLTRDFEINESSYLAPYSTVRGQTLFAYADANPDAISHFRTLGTNTFGFEDIIGGGDRDYDDHVFAFDFTSVL